MAEVALGTVALVGSLLFLQRYLGARSVSPGVETSGRLASGHLLDSLLNGVASREPGILSTVAALLVLLAALSALGPALRAIRVDPMGP